MAKLAVIQSVYKNDKPEYLIKSIGSILSQTFSSFTYYIGIDGPIAQNLRNVLYSITDSRVVIIENKENKGLAAILNDLLEKCKEGDFDYIARMDSDDIAIQNRFKLQIDHLEQNADVDALGGAINEIDENGNVKTNLPIDWDSTLKLWYEDEESYKNKTLLRLDEHEIYKVLYNKENANFNNRSFYEFVFNKDLKLRLKHNIKQGIIDAFLIGRRNRYEG